MNLWWDADVWWCFFWMFLLCELALGYVSVLMCSVIVRMFDVF